jgi:hypothetical protein
MEEPALQEGEHGLHGGDIMEEPVQEGEHAEGCHGLDEEEHAVDQMSRDDEKIH